MRKVLFSRERMPRCSPAATNEILHKPFLTLFHFVRINSFLVNTRFPVSGFSGSNSPCFALKQRIEQFTLEGRVQCSCRRFSKQSSSAKPHKKQRSHNGAASADALGKTQSQGIRSTGGDPSLHFDPCGSIGSGSAMPSGLPRIPTQGNG